MCVCSAINLIVSVNLALMMAVSITITLNWRRPKAKARPKQGISSNGESQTDLGIAFPELFVCGNSHIWCSYYFRPVEFIMTENCQIRHSFC